MREVVTSRQAPRMKKLLVLARVFPPFQSVGHSIRVVKFLKYLPTLGWLPSVLTIDDGKEYESDHRQGSETLLAEIPQVPIYRTPAGEPSWKYLQREREFGQRNWLTWVLAKVFGGTRRRVFRYLLQPDRSLLWLPFALVRGRQIVKSDDMDVIFVTCPPHSATLIGAFLKLFTRKPLILDFRDDWVDTPWYHSQPAIVRTINRRLERWVVKLADKVILVTGYSRNAFLHRYPNQPPQKFILVPNGCDLGEFSVLNRTRPTSRNSRFTILHAGTLNDTKHVKHWARSPATLLQAVHSILKREQWLAEDLNLTFTGVLPDRQKQLVNELGLSKVVRELGFLPRDEFIRFMQAADLLVVINYEGFATLIPGKLYEYWAVGGPPILLLSCPGAAAELVKQHRLGMTVESSDVAGIKNAILEVYRRRESGRPIRVRTAGIEAYDRKALTRQLAHVLASLSAGY